MILGLDRTACRRHADALLDVVDGRVETPASTAALHHLEWCRPCADELSDLALAIVGFRRLGSLPVPEEAVTSGWPRLRRRILQTRAAAAAAAWRWRATLGGLAASTLIVAAVVGPSALDLSYAGGAAEPTGYSLAQLESQDRRLESLYIWQASKGSASARSEIVSAAGSAGLRRYPDNVQPERKEVPARSSGRVPEVD